VAIVSANRTGDRGFKSRKGARFNLRYYCYCVYLSEINVETKILSNFLWNVWQRIFFYCLLFDVDSSKVKNKPITKYMYVCTYTRRICILGVESDWLFITYLTYATRARSVCWGMVDRVLVCR
jgi:hypothetical protein